MGDMNILELIEFFMDEYGMKEEDAEREAAIITFGYCEDDDNEWW